MKPPVGDWAEQRACKGRDPEEFFPGRGDLWPIYSAKVICAGCPVRLECATYALTSPKERDGIWGGFTGMELRKLDLATIAKGLPPVKLPNIGGRPSKDPKPVVHGTTAGYAYHWRNGEAVCDECTEAKRAYDRTRVRGTTGRRLTPIDHGTYSGYLKHRRRGEDACLECKAAAAKEQRERVSGRILEVVR